MSKKFFTTYTDAIEFIEYMNICLQAGHNTQHAFFLACTNLTKGKFKNDCVEVLKFFEIGHSFGNSLQLASQKNISSSAKEIFENLHMSLKLGTKVTKTLKQLSLQIRLNTMSQLETIAHEAPVKMIFPLVIFIFPVIFILLGTKAFINFIQSLGV